MQREDGEIRVSHKLSVRLFKTTAAVTCVPIISLECSVLAAICATSMMMMMMMIIELLLLLLFFGFVLRREKKHPRQANRGGER